MKNTKSFTGKKETRKQIEAARRRKERTRSILIYGGIGLAVLVVVGLIILGVRNSSASNSLMGDPVTVTSRAHVDPSKDPGPYNSNPPAGGQHFPTTLPTKFYEESDVASLPPYPQGYLVHNLEHGYVIFWYNCSTLSTAKCDSMKQDIRDVMAQFGGTKLIAFPWPSQDVPLAMTSWGRILKLNTPDTKTMAQFVKSNRYQAPEPNAE